MAQITKNFEKKFAKYVGSKYSLMVNSGSSANLLVAFALVNPKKKNRLKVGRINKTVPPLLMTKYEVKV